ncbi:MAG: DNA polymerase III subunit beta, partial [Rickettsiales bacterium]|nr:DNA polymerase III subunit beta [Rickettsiales bacterium]
PILSNAKFVAGNELTITATNVDLELIEKVPAKVEKEGKVTIPAHTLYDIVRKLPEDSEIKFELKGNEIVLKAGKSEFKLPTLPADDFPMMAGANLPHKFKMSPEDLIALIDKTKFAISTEETRYQLNGVYLHTTEKNGQPVLRAVATDGTRLALYEIPAPDGAKGMSGVIIPKQVIYELRKILDDGKEDITIEISETKTRFSFKSLVMTSKLIDGKFPDYTNVIPKNNKNILNVNCKQFINGVDRISSVSDDKYKTIKINVKGKKLVLSANSNDIGSGTEELDVQYSSETPLESTFKVKFLLELTSQISTDNAEFLFSDGLSPCIIQEPKNNNFLYVMMPLRR